MLSSKTKLASSIQDDFQALLNARRKKPIDLEEVSKCYRLLALRLGGGDKVLPALQKFDEKADTAVWKACTTLVTAKSRFADLKSNRVRAEMFFCFVLFYFCFETHHHNRALCLSVKWPRIRSLRACSIASPSWFFQWMACNTFSHKSPQSLRRA